MRKEILWAGIIGISFGLVIAFGAYRINSQIRSRSGNTTASPTPKANSEFKITLDRPEGGDVVTEDVVSVSGITKPLTWLTVSGEDGDYIIQADGQGVFGENVELIPGVNQIKLTAFDPQGNQSIEKVIVVYSSVFQLKTVAEDSQVASEGSDLRQRVQAKVEAAMNKPKAYIGVVTDIADSTIQINSPVSGGVNQNEIKQISVGASEITVVKTGTVNKTVKLTDIAIGDFIVAMGYINVSGVLSAQRILITESLTDPKIDSVLGKVTDVSKKTITLTTLKDGETREVTPGTKTDIVSFDQGGVKDAKLSEIGAGDLIIYIVDGSSDTLIIRSVFIVSKES